MRKKLIDEILELEWKYFTRANNTGGRAECQDNKEEFQVMRKSQWETLPEDVLESYLEDLRECKYKNIDIVVEKYARMMKFNAPDEYEKIKNYLSEISLKKKEITEKIIEIYMKWELEVKGKYPKICGKGRPLYSKEDTLEVVSIETYLRGELYSYSERTLEKYYSYILKCREDKRNLALENIENIVVGKGYKNLEDAENKI